VLLGLWRTERCSANNQRSVLNSAAWCRTLALPPRGDLDHAVTFTGGPVGLADRDPAAGCEPASRAVTGVTRGDGQTGNGRQRLAKRAGHLACPVAGQDFR
jgi:hypothetical protein